MEGTFRRNTSNCFGIDDLLFHDGDVAGDIASQVDEDTPLREHTGATVHGVNSPYYLSTLRLTLDMLPDFALYQMKQQIIFEHLG